MRLAFTLEYDGTNFSGFQRQTNAITIQEQIENAIKKVEGSDISINYSGRTDAGVHALSQVFDFETDILRDHRNWIDGINSNLPKTISVKKVFEVPIDFNSRFSAKERKYSYVIYNSKNKPLFFDRFSHWVTNKLDIDIMTNQLQMFKGEHDFTSFRSSSCNSKNPIKTISNVDIQKINNFIIITISANAFLQNMVRIMVGTLIDIAKKENNSSISEIIMKKDRSFAGKTSPSSGLFFLGPTYLDNLGIDSLESSIFDRLKA